MYILDKKNIILLGQQKTSGSPWRLRFSLRVALLSLKFARSSQERISNTNSGGMFITGNPCNCLTDVIQFALLEKQLKNKNNILIH